MASLSWKQIPTSTVDQLDWLHEAIKTATLKNEEHEQTTTKGHEVKQIPIAIKARDASLKKKEKAQINENELELNKEGPSTVRKSLETVGYQWKLKSTKQIARSGNPKHLRTNRN